MLKTLLAIVRFFGGAYLIIVGIAIVVIGIADFIRWVA